MLWYSNVTVSWLLVLAPALQQSWFKTASSRVPVHFGDSTAVVDTAAGAASSPGLSSLWILPPTASGRDPACPCSAWDGEGLGFRCGGCTSPQADGQAAPPSARVTVGGGTAGSSPVQSRLSSKRYHATVQNLF